MNSDLETAWNLRRSDPKRALALGEKAYAAAKEANDLSAEAYSLLVTGYSRVRLSEPELASEQLRKALALFEGLDDKDGERKTLNALGILYGESGDLTGALKTFLALQTLCAELDDKKGEADALNNVGLSYLFLGDVASALEYHLRALDLYQTHGFSDGVGCILNNLGEVQQELDRPKDALGYFLKSLDTGEELDIYTRAHTLSNVGRSYLKLRNLEQALSYTSESLTLMEELGDRLGASYTLDDLGLTYMRMGQLSQADDCLTKSLTVKKEVGAKKGEAETCILLGRLYTRQGRLELALDYLHEGLACAQTADAKTEVYKAHEALAEAYEQNRQFREATLHLKLYLQVKDKVFNEKSDLRLQGLQIRFEVEQTLKEKEIYRLKNVELAEAIDELNELTASLQKADEEKTLLLEQLEKQTREDSLTGLFNRRYFDTKLEQEFGRAKRYGSLLSVMVCDIDDFKRINDTFSHQVGDEVLRRFAAILQAQVRQVDTVARYGGEEFVILFPETPAAEAVKVSERIRAAVVVHVWQGVAPGLKVTISAGVSADLSVSNYEKLVGLADGKLYEAKRSGKNRVNT